MMWIPVIVIAWNLNGLPTFVNFPMVNFPFTSETKCNQYINQVRSSIVKDPQYIEGYSGCVKVKTKEGQNT